MSALSSRDDKFINLQASGEFQFTENDFIVIARTLYDEAGIHLKASKATLVYSRIAKRLRVLGLEGFQDYCNLIGQESGAEERAQMITALTTNVTRFFREPHHFEHLKSKVLPRLLDGARQGKRIRIWSAGCSSGQEPYSIALTILSLMPDARSFDIRILATDISPKMITAGKRGRYVAEDLADVPGDLKLKWMEKSETGGESVFDDAVRGLISFRELNLMNSWPMHGPFDAIFCRNVVIYFDEQTQHRIWSRMLPILQPGGLLYIGHSERVSGPALQHLALEATTTYRKSANPAKGAV